MASLVFDFIVNRPETREWLKHKAHDWLPAYFSRYDLTPEENLLVDQKNALQAALVDKDPNKLIEILDLFPHLINQPLNNGEIPIAFAVKQNLQDKIDTLLAKGADPTCKDRIGLNALDIALQKREKELFAKLIANKFDTKTGADQFIKALDSVVVTGSAAKNELKTIIAEASATRAELEKIKLKGDVSKLFQAILKGDFVQFKQIATPEKMTELSEKVTSQQLLTAAILGSPLVLEAMLSIGFQPPEIDSFSQHPMRFALCSRHPIEAYIPLFDKFKFDIHSLTTSKESVSYFDLVVYQKMQNAQNMDPLAVTIWDVAFAAFSLLSFAANHQYIPLPTSAIPWARTALIGANHLQAISLLLFKLSYSREGKVSAAMQQLMTHYVISRFLPVRLYYAFMTVYSGWATCREHKYRSYGDLFKKMIIQVPAAAEVAHHTWNVATAYLKSRINLLRCPPPCLKKPLS